MVALFSISLSFLIALVVSARIVPSIVRASRTLKLFDVPNDRSSSNSVTPTLGGIAIFLGIVLGVVITINFYVVPKLSVVLAAIIIMLFVGLKDDILSISPKNKLIAQIGTAIILIIVGDFRFTNLHGILGIGEINMIVSVIVTTFVMIVFINAFNLIDGIDGLAAGVSILAASVFGVCFYLNGHPEYSILSFSLVGSLMSFFYYNVYGKRNKIFMGDTGSLILGTVMVILVIKFNEFNCITTTPYAVASAPAISFGILIYPLWDTLRVFFIRIAQKHSPFLADKNHIHHRLLTLGMSHKRATYTILTFNILFLIPLFMLQNIGIYWLMAFNVVTAFVVCLIPSVIICKRMLIKEDDPHQIIIFLRSSFLFKQNRDSHSN